jgi:phosphotransferase system enzyme I (PtsP)
MGIGDLPLGRLEGVNIVADGYQGRIFINPSPAVLDEFQRLVREEEELSAELEALRDLPAETADCVRVLLYSNVALLSNITPSLNNGAEGVGLYRTEVPLGHLRCEQRAERVGGSLEAQARGALRPSDRN